ncbi:MAG TPA: flagellar hook basal-body protein [Candidatus Sulfotelmatobacter sp.]|nr:flagellar hook basal-body protein [Candidatus Sulfotelmatobacter sp.]
MDSGFYSAFTGFSARLDELDLLANNLANTNTPGYKAQYSFYRALPAWLQASLTTPLNTAVNRYGVLAGSHLDLTVGTIETTGNPTDLALESSGFFNVQTKNGLRYTRAGNFQLNTQRQLVTPQGDLVLGEAGPIQIPTGVPTISADGTVSADGAMVAKVKLTDFAADTPLTAEGSNYLVAPANAGKPAANPQVRQGALETSNADPVGSAVSLIDVQRTAQMMEKALSIFHNEFNKTAAQDLSRI